MIAQHIETGNEIAENRAKVEGKVNVKAAITDTSMKTFDTALKAGFVASGKKDIKE